MKQIIAAADIDEKRWPARLLASMIDGWKNRGLMPADVSAGEGGGFADGRGKALYAAYQERLKTLNAADFGDLLLHNLRIFREHADVLAQYQSRFRYMLVDEYQDTNVAQYLWLRLLAQRPSPHRRGLSPQGGRTGAPLLQRHSGAERSEEPGIDNHRGGYGFRARHPFALWATAGAPE